MSPRCGLKAIAASVLAVAASSCMPALAQSNASNKPNILVIWGDDIGLTNVSAYSDGLMGYTTPNIDRIADEGLRFLQYYGEQSCTAPKLGKAAEAKRLKQFVGDVGKNGVFSSICTGDLTEGLSKALKTFDQACKDFPVGPVK